MSGQWQPWIKWVVIVGFPAAAMLHVSLLAQARSLRQYRMGYYRVVGGLFIAGIPLCHFLLGYDYALVLSAALALALYLKAFRAARNGYYRAMYERKTIYRVQIER